MNERSHTASGRKRKRRSQTGAEKIGFALRDPLDVVLVVVVKGERMAIKKVLNRLDGGKVKPLSILCVFRVFQDLEQEGAFG